MSIARNACKCSSSVTPDSWRHGHSPRGVRGPEGKSADRRDSTSSLIIATPDARRQHRPKRHFPKMLQSRQERLRRSASTNSSRRSRSPADMTASCTASTPGLRQPYPRSSKSMSARGPWSMEASWSWIRPSAEWRRSAHPNVSYLLTVGWAGVLSLLLPTLPLISLCLLSKD